ncbi:Acylamino-acid-releasing enzyme, putative isoform 1 [Hibiscus syriacus]|uniref:Acylamino-acid-releasing enzyme, putative isoform 1 n=1 Tax=Hibiscus syriacus TaxID=106335 RepID=A0A6A2X6H1_HIBSY|nr:uncharacterized protein LOC120198230 [Hibiscus syriacus]KAE8653979.1 Acylamino-acid-releasing enzyme, putative isoform 1 [Hibiscus syriacus]
MEVMKATSPNLSFDFNSAPSSPRRFGECFFSAPTSPSRLSDFYCEFDGLSTMDDTQITESCMRNTSLAVPFDWEDRTGTPKSLPTTKIRHDDDGFAFHFRQPSGKTLQLSAEELFDGGKIKPLKPPPRLRVVNGNDEKTSFLSSPRSSKSPLPQGKKIFQAFSPRKKKEPFETAIERSVENTENGRGRVEDSSSKNSTRRTTRSLSPYRVSELPLGEQQEKVRRDQNNETTGSNQSSLSWKLPSSSKGSSGKWKLKDLLLFRSASEGHNKDPFRKYSSFFRKPEDNYNKNSSFKSKDTSKRKVSAHELHYTTNKAASENMKKKTFMPYKQGILGKFSFNSIGSGTLAPSYNNAK